ncbi:MAG TPA: PEGA domain-containing protein [Caulobacteraceae bacterium]|jgi:hypothetical protein|nr:PEGA domain-containing protein [Caulobacteraceae bacterium]
MNKFLRLGALWMAACSLGACATVTRGTNAAWEVSSNPPGAAVTTTNGMQCAATPCSLKMSRKSEFVATITKPGYKPATVQVTHKVGTGGGAAMAGNVLVGGLIGGGLDLATGAMNDLTPNPVTVTLEKLDATVVAAAK